MIIKVEKAEYRGGHRVWLHFSDGSEGEVDLAAELWGEVFEPLKDPARFRAFKLDGTITWEHGADFAPEFLHDLMRRQTVGPDVASDAPV